MMRLKRMAHLVRRAIDAMVFVLFGGVVCARRLGVKVGQDCRIYSQRFGAEPFLVEMGDRVTVTSGVTFLTHDGAAWLVRDEKGRRYHYRRIRIGHDVFIGINAVLLPGVIIGNRVIVGAGSVVTRSVPDGCIVAGNPARCVGTYAQYEARALATWPYDTSATGRLDYRRRVMTMLDDTSRPELRSTVPPPPSP